MNNAQDQSANFFDLAAALGPNVVRFVPPQRDEAQPANADWTTSLDLIDRAADFIKANEQRVMAAEARADKVAAKAMEGLRTAHTRVLKAEEQAREVESQAKEELRQAYERITGAEAWAQTAEERAQEAERRAEAAEARAKEAEEALRRVTDALRQKLSFAAAASADYEPLPQRRALAG